MRILITLLIATTSLNLWAFEASEVYEKRCSACHTIGLGSKAGPDLKDVTKRREMSWLVKWLMDPMALVKSGDKTAVELFNKHNTNEMPSMSDLGRTEVKRILEFIEKTGDEVAAKDPNAAKLSPRDAKIKKGHALAVSCAACHGNAGITNDPTKPHLAGQNLDYLVTQLLAFQSGFRKDPTGSMAAMVGALSKEDIEALAAYFNSLNKTAK